MEKLLKFFPLMPEKKNTGKLILAILFYVYVPFVANAIVSSVLGVTFVLIPVVPIVNLVCNVYAIAGIGMAILNYLDKKLCEVCAKKDEE